MRAHGTSTEVHRVTEERIVPSYPRLRVRADGTVIGYRGRPLKAFPNKLGYMRVTLPMPGKRWKQVSVHSLICEAFHGPKPEWADVVAHTDGNPGNASAANLR